MERTRAIIKNGSLLNIQVNNNLKQQKNMIFIIILIVMFVPIEWITDLHEYLTIYWYIASPIYVIYSATMILIIYYFTKTRKVKS